MSGKAPFGLCLFGGFAAEGNLVTCENFISCLKCTGVCAKGHRRRSLSRLTSEQDKDGMRVKGSVMATVMAGLMAGVTALALPCMALALEFTPRDILAWQSESFQGQTVYAMDGEALRARCFNSASGLFLERKIDLRVTPVIEWSWRVDAVFDASVDETSKAGDDFPARLYVVRDGGVAVWRTRAINYVWASAMPVGSSWPNPFASQARMVALRSGAPAAPGQWVTERRNIREDFRRFHGRDVETIDAVAIMTDCDNRAATAEAWYGRVRFLAE